MSIYRYLPSSTLIFVIMGPPLQHVLPSSRSVVVSVVVLRNCAELSNSVHASIGMVPRKLREIRWSGSRRAHRLREISGDDRSCKMSDGEKSHNYDQLPFV